MFDWHDLRKHPTDLPKENHDVFMVNDYGERNLGVMRYSNFGTDKQPNMVAEWKRKYYTCDLSNSWEAPEDGIIIGWRELFS